MKKTCRNCKWFSEETLHKGEYFCLDPKFHVTIPQHQVEENACSISWKPRTQEQKLRDALPEVAIESLVGMNYEEGMNFDQRALARVLIELKKIELVGDYVVRRKE